eukprot:gene14428-16568_t
MSGQASAFSAAANLAKLCIGVGVLALPYATSIGGLLLQQITATNFSTPVLAVAFAVLALPLSCVDNVGVLAMFSALGLVCLIVSVIAIIVYGIIFYGSDALSDPLGGAAQHGGESHLTNPINDSHHHLTLWPESLSAMSSFIGVATFCFGLCSLAFPVEESMQNKKEFGKAVTWSLMFVWFVYVLLGDVGAILFVHDIAKGIRDNILSNLPVDSFVAFLVRLAMAGVALLTYPLTLVPPAHMLEHYMLSYSCFPSSTVCDLVPEGLHTAGSSARHNGYGALEMADVTDSETGSPTPLGSEVDLYSAAGGESHREVSFAMRCINRSLIVLMTTVISTWIPCFGMVIALLGGFTVTILSFILPSYLHLQIVGYQKIHGATTSSSPFSDINSFYSKGGLPATVEMSSEERSKVIKTDIALTAGGAALCLISTAVTTIGFLSRVSSEGGSCT